MKKNDEYKRVAQQNSPFILFHNYRDYPILHTHDGFWEFTLVTDGTYSHIINNKKIKLKKGFLCLIRPQDAHMLESLSPEVSHINLTIRDEAMKAMLEIVSSGFYETLLNSEPICFELSQMAVNNYIEIYNKIEFQEHSTNEQRFTVSQMFLVFINDIIKNHVKLLKKDSPNVPEIIKNIIDAINSVSNSSKTLAEIFESWSYSYVHISRLFKNYMKMTLKQYYLNAKMKIATQLLEDPSISILAIAQKLGYTSLKNFNITFKKHFNRTPTNFRKGHFEYYNSFDDA